MTKLTLWVAVIIGSVLNFSNTPTDPIKYTVAAKPWNDDIKDINKQEAKPDVQPTAPNYFSLGNHRAILRVPATGEVSHLDLEWRRHDKHVDRHRFIIINANTRDTVKNIQRVEVNNEHCEILFGPVQAGVYYFYYLPFEKQGGWGQYEKDYLPRELPSDSEWIKQNRIADKAPTEFIPAKCLEIQARTQFDSFYPMEVIATDVEKKALATSHDNPKFLLFPEDRKYPIRMLDNIPQRWVLKPVDNAFEGTACRNEYYAFQIGLWALDTIENVQVEFSPLKGDNFTIPESAMTCFNTGGIDPSGNVFKKSVNVSGGGVQPLWIGIDLPKDIPSGSYHGNLIVRSKNAGQEKVSVTINVTNEILADRGDGEPWRHSRLRWLNSTLGIDDNPVAPWDPVKVENQKLILTGKEVSFTGSGMPASIHVFGEDVLAAPIQFAIETSFGSEAFKIKDKNTVKQEKGIYAAEVLQESESMNLLTRYEVESDGWMKYYFDIKALKNISITDIQLKIPYRKENSVYLSGMDLYGVNTPDDHDAKWDPLYDAFWLGSTNGGLYCELRGATYSGPLLYFKPIRDFYRPSPPESWYNNNKGGFRIRTIESERNAIVYSGPRTLKKGESILFECAFMITPIKKLDAPYRFTDRYYHNQYHPEPSEEDAAVGVKVANLHHANKFNPYINYPFIETDEMRGYVDRCHQKGIKAKIYHTTRELSNFAMEIWALRSLGDEILTGGSGGGYPWLREHLVDNYTPQWYQYLGGSKGADAAILTSVGMTRWYNYYIEGLKWLVKNVGIDGLYIDAAAYDRELVKRIRKAMDSVKPGCLLDLHEGHDCILRYLEFFPYLDKTWIGESIDYNTTEAVDYLVSISGIPMGSVSDMLHEGANPWRGVVYGMTTRYGWTTNGIFCDPRPVWKVWDAFGIEEAKMIGYWEQKTVVGTNNPDVKATAYVKEGKLLVAVASWAKETVKVKLSIDWNAVGLNKAEAEIHAPEIKNFQPEKLFSADDEISIDPTKGWLLVIE